MSSYLKPQSPLYHKAEDAYFYPLTTADQVIMPDGSRLSAATMTSENETSNAVLYVEQNLTEEQKEQARENIGVIIPTKVSELENDSNYLTSIPSEYVTESELNVKGYLTSYTESDPTVPDWAKEPNKPTYTASDVGALPADTVIPTVPTNVSAFTNDAGYISNKPGLVYERLDSGIYGWIECKYANIDNGNIYDTVHYCVTDYLEVNSEWQKIITYVGAFGDYAGICFFDSTKKFISGVAHGATGGEMALFEYDIPYNASYFCFATKLSTVNLTYAEVVKYADGLLTRMSSLEDSIESLSKKTSVINYGYAAANILCIGDSLTNGAYYAGEANGLDIADGTAIAQNYPYYLSRMLHCRTTNAGTNGYSASDWYNTYINNYVYADYDTFIIWLGTNYGCTTMPTDAEISTFVPSNSASASTANQALYLIKIIQTIQEANTSCHIVLGNVFGSKSDKTVNNEVVAQIAEKYGCQLVDMSDLSYSNHPELHAGINNPHFGKAGNIYIANRLATAINEYIASNPSAGDFGTTVKPMPTLTANEKEEIIASVIASLPVYTGEVI